MTENSTDGSQGFLDQTGPSLSANLTQFFWTKLISEAKKRSNLPDLIKKQKYVSKLSLKTAQAINQTMLVLKNAGLQFKTKDSNFTQTEQGLTTSTTINGGPSPYFEAPLSKIGYTKAVIGYSVETR